MSGLRRWLRTPPSHLPPARRIPLWALGGSVTALTALQMFRRPSPPPVWDSLIAEDGQIFLTQALGAPWVDNLTTSYQGYLHTAPRIIAKVATWFPLEDAPLVMSLAFALCVAFAAVYVFQASAAWIASPPLRAVLALAIPFIPVTAWQMAGTVSNLHWYLLYAAFWAVLCPWRTPGWLVASTGLVLVAVLSDPLVGVFLPIGVVLAVRSRDRRAWIVPGAIALGIVATFVLRDEGTTALPGSHYGLLPRIFADRVTSSLLVGDRYLEDVFGGVSGSPFAWISLALVAAAVGYGLARLRGRRAWVLGGCAALSVAFFVSAGFARGTAIWDPDHPWVLLGTRYVYLPVLFMLTALLAAVDRERPGGGRPPARELLAAGLAVAVMAVGYAAPHRSSGELRWKPVLAKARRTCATGVQVPPVTLSGQGGGASVFVPIDPRPRWAVRIACSRLD